MTAQEVATYLAVSRTKVQRLIDAQHLVPIDAPNPMLGRRRLQFRRADVEHLKANPPPVTKPGRRGRQSA